MRTPLCALLLLSVCLVACAYDVDVSMGGQTKRIWTYPHKPVLSVGTIEELRANWNTVKPLVPAMPFIMEGKWIVPSPDGVFRVVPRHPELLELFSPSGDYVAAIEPRHDVFEFPSSCKHMKLLRSSGEVVWEMEAGPIWAIVNDDGSLVGRSQYNEDLSLTFYGPEGGIVKPADRVFLPGKVMSYTGRLTPLPALKMLLAWEQREIVAFSLQGEVLWRFSPPDDVPIEFITDPGLDPLGRGIYVPIVYKDDTSILLLDPTNGKPRGAVWEHKPISLPQYFSAEGKYAGIATEKGIGLVDWTTGSLLFYTNTAEHPEVWTPYDESCGTSDTPPRLAVSVGGEEGVFDTTGQMIWSVNVRQAGYHRLAISADGASLGLSVGKSHGYREPFEMYGLLLFKVE